MLLSKTVKIKWNSKNKNHYVSLGYVFTKMKDDFEILVEHLTKGSDISVSVQCDYCNKIYTVQWRHYLNSHNLISKDCCSNSQCTGMKASESLIKKYGTRNIFEIDEIDNKRKNTNLERYGFENPFSNDKVKNKIKETNLNKYGYEYSMQNDTVKKKSQETCLEKYGVINYGAIYSKEHSKELSPTWKGGSEYSRVERSTIEYRIWRKSVFSRDNYTCQCCGQKSGNGKAVELNAHHIMDWKHNIDLRYEITNGITLCKDCHIKFHSDFGKSGNNNEQLIEFLNKNKDKKVC